MIVLNAIFSLFEYLSFGKYCSIIFFILSFMNL